MTEEIFEQARALARAEVELVNAMADIQPRIDMLEASAASVRKTIGELSLGIQYKRDAIEQMRAALLKAMGDADHVAFGGVSITVKKAGGVQALEIDEPYKSIPSELPERYQMRKIVADAELIREDLANGEDVPFARLRPRKRTVIVEVAI